MNDNHWPSYAATIMYHQIQKWLTEARQLPPSERTRYYLARVTGKYQTRQIAKLLGVSPSTVQRVTRERVAAGMAFRSEGWVINRAD